MTDSSTHPPSRILITGANGALGSVTARYFLDRDPTCHVFLGVRANRDNAAALSAEFPNRAFVLALDVTSEDEWKASLEKAIELSGGPVTVLVNNAGFHDDALLATMRPNQWSSVLDANLNAVFTGCQAVLNGMMRERFGRIVNISSLSAMHSPAGQANYAAAKAGVIGLTQSLAKESARMGITVNAICPGYIDGGLPADWTEEHQKALKRQIPMRRFARPEEIAAAVFFLASRDASYITGASLKIDGGII